MHVRNREPEYDAIVVGSGMTGGWAAKELTELGLETLVLEAGRPIAPERDYREHVPVFEIRFRGLGDRRAIEARRVDPDIAAVASQANVGGGTSALAVARSLGRPDLVLPSILVGSLGNALGTFLGFWTAAMLV